MPIQSRGSLALLFFAACAGCAVWAQQTPAAPLPSTHGKTISGKTVTIPDQNRPRTLIVAGFTKNSSASVKVWWERAEALCKAHPMVACYRVAVLQDVPGFIRGMVVGGIRRDLTPGEQDSFVTVFENEAAWKEAFHVTAPDDAYLGLFDKGGTLLWHTLGEEKAANAMSLGHAFESVSK